MAFETISVVGLGYIGLPTAAILAARGERVVGVEINPRTVEIINQGRIHIIEPDLDMLVRSAVTTGHLRAVVVPEPADAFLVAVPTPFHEDGHKPDVSYIQAAAEAIAPVLKRGDLVILESTSPVGTTEQMVAWMAALRPDLTFPRPGGEGADIHVAYCPERVLPGQVVRELVENDRVVGGITPACARAAERLYRIFVQGRCIITNARTAEMAKLTENAFRDVNIAFANELSLICDRLGIDVWELIRLANHHPRVNILQPGPGVGGHCIAVDPWFIVDSAPDEARLIRTAREVNDGKPAVVLNQVEAALAGIGTPTVACLGLAFKANIDDLRESPALAITARLAQREGTALVVVEPHISALPPALADHPRVRLEGDLPTALAAADLVLVLVDHTVFRKQLPGLLGVGGKPVIDTRGILSAS